MSLVWTSLAVVGLGLVAVLLAVILRSGGWRRYPFLTAYLIFAFVYQVTAMAIYEKVNTAHSRLYANTYYTGDLVLHGLVLLMVLFLIREALLGQRPFDLSALIIFGAGVAFVVVTLAMLFNPNSGSGWVFTLSRNLSFIEELLNFVLWTILIRNRSRDIVLLLVSAGLGIQVTGEVIGRTARLYTRSPAISWLPDAIILLAEIGALLIWYRAFGAYSRQKAAKPQSSFAG